MSAEAVTGALRVKNHQRDLFNTNAHAIHVVIYDGSMDIKWGKQYPITIMQQV